MNKKTTMPPAAAARPDPGALQIVHYPHPVLKKVAKDVEQFDDWLKAVVARMKVLMVEHKGVGLAAPQVGLPLRLFIWAPSGELAEAKAFINPVIFDEHGSEEAEEGCLSLPDIRCKIGRAKRISIVAVSELGEEFSLELEAFPARVAQHEYDHLDGVLLLDRMSPVAKLANRRKIKALEDAAKPAGKK